MVFKLRNIKDVMSRKYGTGEYSRTDKSKKAAMKPGESKFQYDVRMRKEGSRTPSTKTQDPFKSIKPRGTEITGLTGGPSYENPARERKPGDYRVQSSWSVSTLPSAPGDKWKYSLHQDSAIGYEGGVGIGGGVELWARDEDGEMHKVEPGSDSDKAIRERYTGSETGGLENWYGRGGYTSSESIEVDPVSGEMIPKSYRSEGDAWRERYLPYDLAQKHYNPNYKGSKK